MAWWSCALGTRSGQHLVLGPGLGGSSQVRARRGIGGRPRVSWAGGNATCSSQHFEGARCGRRLPVRVHSRGATCRARPTSRVDVRRCPMRCG
ncbi:hypothetical protein HN51_051007, partial [Arachis hypogaea]